MLTSESRCLEGVTPLLYKPKLLYSPIGLDPKLLKWTPEGSTKVMGSGARFCCLDNYFQGIFGGPFR